jgi:hypothetical protein
VASLSAQTISFDKLFGLAKIGTFWLGGGWQVTPAWTKDTAMGTLPSADGWTWTTARRRKRMHEREQAASCTRTRTATPLTDGYYAKARWVVEREWVGGNGERFAFRTDGQHAKHHADQLLNVEDGQAVRT